MKSKPRYQEKSEIAAYLRHLRNSQRIESESTKALSKKTMHKTRWNFTQ